jgi:hypothetical protein
MAKQRDSGLERRLLVVAFIVGVPNPRPGLQRSLSARSSPCRIAPFEESCNSSRPPRARTVTTGERIPSQDTSHPSSPPRSLLLRRNSGTHVAHSCRPVPVISTIVSPSGVATKCGVPLAPLASYSQNLKHSVEDSFRKMKLT